MIELQCISTVNPRALRSSYRGFICSRRIIISQLAAQTHRAQRLEEQQRVEAAVQLEMEDEINTLEAEVTELRATQAKFREATTQLQAKEEEVQGMRVELSAVRAELQTSKAGEATHVSTAKELAEMKAKHADLVAKVGASSLLEISLFSAVNLPLDPPFKIRLLCLKGQDPSPRRHTTLVPSPS